MAQAGRIWAMVRQRPSPLTAPIPNSAPQETWVVETGRPSGEASVTRAAVTALAAKAWPWSMAVISNDMVRATRRGGARAPPGPAPPPEQEGGRGGRARGGPRAAGAPGGGGGTRREE